MRGLGSRCSHGPPEARRRDCKPPLRVLLPLLALLAVVKPSTAVTPTGEIVFSGTTTVYAAPAAFGPGLPVDSSHKLKLTLVQPLELQDGCEPKVRVPADVARDGFGLLVQRSPNCSFEDRALAAQRVNASALVVQNTIEGILQNRSHAESKTDYECSNGKSYESSLADEMDGFPTSSCALDSACDSGRCLATGDRRDSDGAHKVCCAWDLYMTMAGSDGKVDLPAVFVTMRDADKLVADFSKQKTRRQLKAQASTTMALDVEMNTRWRPWMNLSSLLIWAMGVATVAFAAWRSVDDLRRKIARSDATMLHATDTVVAVAVADDEEEAPPALELSTTHAFGFIVVASSVLLVLFYVNLYLLVTVMFCISSASSVGQVLLRPLFSRVLGERSRQEIADIPYLGGVSMLDAACTSVGVFLAVLWFVNRNTSDWAFVLQDTFGMCLCVLFLSVIRFSNMKVAALLLSMSFIYDIFFVFISPYFFSESVMVKVATGTTPKADPDFCEKYPSDSDCQSTELPMLLLLPRINDYQGGDTMLGLGDIVLPGLLVAFAARYDVSVRAEVPSHYVLMVLGYAAGLLMANIAVYAMNTGQPALLYLVPCTLGVLSLQAWREGILHDLWHGPPTLQQDNGQPMMRKGGYENGALFPATATPVGKKDTEDEPLLTRTI